MRVTEIRGLVLGMLKHAALYGLLQPEELGKRLPTCALNWMFSVVDRFSREGRLEIQHPDHCTYVVRLRTPFQGAAGSRLGSRVAEVTSLQTGA